MQCDSSLRATGQIELAMHRAMLEGGKGGVEISGMKFSGVNFPRHQFLLHGSTWMCRPSSSHAIDRDNDRQLFFSGPNEFCIGSPCALGSHSSVEKKCYLSFFSRENY